MDNPFEKDQIKLTASNDFKTCYVCGSMIAIGEMHIKVMVGEFKGMSRCQTC
tara:strand:+ start:564 stop:719 length:156 start_codon:yes stop_codon:yes gene_type:complete